MATSSPTLDPPTLPAVAVGKPGRQATLIVLGQAFSRWALWAAVFVSFLLGAQDDLGPSRLLSGLIMALLGFAFVSLGDGVVTLLWFILGRLLSLFRLDGAARHLAAIPPAMIGRLLGVFVYIAGDVLWPDSILQHVMVPPVGELFIVLMAITGMLLALARRNSHALPGQVLPMFAAALNITFLIWVFQPGTDSHVARMATGAAAPTLSLPDPGIQGPYAVHTLTYGSGVDLHRKEYATQANLLTEPVDGQRIFEGYAGLGGDYFQWYWGFDFASLPLNGLVWYPQGEGPFPIVLIVHGNHAMTAPSDRGYAYLGEHLASHGYIAVSVDENFLNGVAFLDGDMEEMPLRAWLLLKHLQQWRAWNQTPGNPFFEQVDLQHVALIGHSRGGEAVAVAAQMNWHVAPPVLAIEDADGFGFGIDAVVAIAPSDGNYKPYNRAVSLTRSDYLLLAGGHDADTYVLYGQAQYNRVHFDDNPDGFKALAYVYQGNHGQFNTLWGDRDRGWLNSLLLNRKPLLSAREQEVTAKALITAFLEASLHGESGYRALFANPGAGSAWLPDGIVATQYEAAGFAPLNAEPAHVSGATTAKREALLLRDGTTSQQNWALYLTWEAEERPVVQIDIEDPRALQGFDALTFALASAQDVATDIDVRLELTLANGRIARLSLDDYAAIFPPLPAKLVKADWLAPLPGYKINVTSPYERVLQSYVLPLAAFQVDGTPFQAAEVRSVQLLLESTQGGAVYLDRLGFIAAP